MGESAARKHRAAAGASGGWDHQLEADKIEVAIARAEQKRKQLVDMQPAAMRSAKQLAMLPRAADTYGRQIELGLENDPRAAGKARVILRKLLGNVRLIPDQGGLWADISCSRPLCSMV